jgi:hypothetical protein
VPDNLGRLQEDLGNAAIRWSRRVYAEVVCTFYEIEPTQLSQRGNRHPARAGLVYLARRHTLATNAELAAVLGSSRAESVPNLTRRFSDWLSTDARIRKQLISRSFLWSLEMHYLNCSTHIESCG